MSKYCSDSSDAPSDRGRRKTKLSARERSYSSSSSSSDSKHRKRKSRRGRRRSHSSEKSSSRKDRDRSKDRYSRRRSRSSSRSYSRRRSKSRSPGKGHYRRRSSSRSSLKSYSKSSKKSRSRSRSRSHSNDRSRRGRRSRSSSRRGRSQSSSRESPGPSSSSQTTSLLSHPDEPLSDRLQKAIWAAKSADELLRNQGLLTKPDDISPTAMISEVINRNTAIEDINSNGFMPRQFVSKRDELPVVVDLTSEPSVPTPVPVKQDPKSIFHSSLLVGEPQRLQRWVTKLYQIRQRAMNGVPMI